MRRAFSLVELSIVLVILGLLVGGILAGQSLIRASELRAVSAEYQRYLTATQAFRDKYFAVPGDMANATQFWGRQSSAADCVTRSGAGIATPGACDGNGNAVPSGNSASLSSEFRQFWRQLAIAGLIEGTYSGVNGSGGTNHCVPGTDCPLSKLSAGGWDIYTYGNNWAGDGGSFAGNYGAFHFLLGRASPTGVPELSLITPDEAWNLDTKLDDGIPGTGKMVARFWNNSCATASSVTDVAAPYKLDNRLNACSLYFRPGF